MPTIGLTDDELVAVAAAIRRHYRGRRVYPAAAAALGRPPEGKGDEAGPQQPRTPKGQATSLLSVVIKKAGQQGAGMQT